MQRWRWGIQNDVLNWLYTHSSATTSDLARELGIPEKQARDALRRLFKRGLLYRWRAPFGRFGTQFPYTSRPYIYSPTPIESWLMQGISRMEAETEIDRAEREVIGRWLRLHEGQECSPDLASKLKRRMSGAELRELRRDAIELLRSRGRIG